MHTNRRRGATRIWLASILVCGLFVAEDPAVLAVRARVGGSTLDRLAIDVALALVMVAYNFAGSRFVIGVAGAADLIAAMDRVDRTRAARVSSSRSPAVRGVRSLVVHANPFLLVRIAGAWIGRGTEQLGHRPGARWAAWVRDLGAVNVLGVPGAGLALRSSGLDVPRGRSLRQCVLFVVSWFTGARLIEQALTTVRVVPVIGSGVAACAGWVGDTFTVLTDVTGPIGAGVLLLVVATIGRYAQEVQRELRNAAADQAFG